MVSVVVAGDAGDLAASPGKIFLDKID